MIDYHYLMIIIQGQFQEFEKGGRGHNTLPSASKIVQVPKKLISGAGGTPTLFC